MFYKILAWSNMTIGKIMLCHNWNNWSWVFYDNPWILWIWKLHPTFKAIFIKTLIQWEIGTLFIDALDQILSLKCNRSTFLLRDRYRTNLLASCFWKLTTMTYLKCALCFQYSKILHVHIKYLYITWFVNTFSLRRILQRIIKYKFIDHYVFIPSTLCIYK